MSMVTYPLNNIEYTAEDAELFHSTRTSGVYATNSFDYYVTGADNTIVIGTGIAWIKNSEFSGKVVAQKESISLDMGLPDSVYPRIDAIVIQFDANKNASEILVKKGVASSNPTPPNVVRTESIYELHVYHVRRYAGSLTISPDSISDLRTNSNYCGLMYDSVTQAVDATLSKSGIAADAEAVGKRISNLKAKDVGAFSTNELIPLANGGTDATTAVKALDNLKALNLDWITDGDYQISSGDDLNNYTVPGAYRCSSASITASLVNATPYTGAGFRLIVTATSHDSNGVLQIAIFNTTTVRIFVRVLNHSGTWGSWNQITTDANIAPTTANVNSDSHTVWFAKIGKLVICTLLPRTTNNHAVYQSDITIPTAYRPASQAQFLIYSSNAYNAGGSQGNNAFGYITANTDGTLRVSNTYGITVQESSRTVMWITE